MFARNPTTTSSILTMSKTRTCKTHSPIGQFVKYAPRNGQREKKALTKTSTRDDFEETKLVFAGEVVLAIASCSL